MIIIPSTLTTYNTDGSATLHITLKTLASIGTKVNMLDSLDEIDTVEIHTSHRSVELEPTTSDKKHYSIHLHTNECSKLSSGEIHIYCTKGHFIFGYIIENEKDNLNQAVYTPEEHRTPFDIG